MKYLYPRVFSIFSFHLHRLRLMPVSIWLMILAALLSQAHGGEKLPGHSKFQKFDRIYEPSGIQQLPDGRFIVVQDESFDPIQILSLDAKGRVTEKLGICKPAISLAGENCGLGKLTDLEAVALGKNGYIYIITSHSRKKKDGKRGTSREKLARFRIEGERIIEPAVVADLKEHIIDKHAIFKQAAKIKDVRSEGSFNIEGLAYDFAQDRLLIGFRTPLADGKAIIITIDSPISLFEPGKAPRVADEVILLDLNGEGIRALAYDPRLRGYLILSRSAGKKKPFRLWLWNGNRNENPKRVKIPELNGLRKAEGITPVRIQGEERILIVSDEGNVDRQKPGRYLLLKYEQLLIK